MSLPSRQFEALVAPHRRELHAYCYRMLGSLQDAEDAVQETLLGAWKGMAGFEGRSALKSWLYRIATNACLRLIDQRPARILPYDRAPASQRSVVEPVIEGAATRVMSLRDGTKKMSKSDPSDQSRINLTDDADTIAAKIRKAKSDSEPLPDTVEGLKDRPEAKNLVSIYAALSGHSVAKVVHDFAGAQFGTFKPALADLAVATLSPITTEMNRLMKDPAEIDRILGDGADRADALARPILEQVFEITGMVRSRPR